LGVPYHSWRITHAKHHASTSHLTQDQAYVPRDRAYLNLPEFDTAKEELSGGSVAEEVKKELVEALGDSPIGAFFGALKYLVSPSMPSSVQRNLITGAFVDHRLARLLNFQLVWSGSLSIRIDQP
jgi:omega-6 fatty acid desaturase (delta-12 desaturase)